MSTTTAKTNGKSAKKIAEAFTGLENKLVAACKTAFELYVPNDRIDSKIICKLSTDSFVLDNVHILHNHYKEEYNEAFEKMEDRAADITSKVNDLGTNGIPIPSGNFDDMKFEELNRLRNYLNTMLCSVDYELKYGERQEPPFLHKELYRQHLMITVLEKMECWSCFADC